MDAVYNPTNETSVRDWFEQIGEATGNEQCWATLRHSLVQVTAATNIFLLKKSRDADVDQAVANAKLSIGYKEALCDYLTPHGSAPFAFAVPVKTLKRASDKGFAPASAMSKKKYASQADRPPLGRELGPDELSNLTFPENLFKSVKHSKELPMKSRGPNSTETVADALWQWVFAKYGSIHVDMAFCERVEELLNERWPILKPWGKNERRWSDVIKNRFMNVRNKVGAEQDEATFKSMRNIPEVDLSSPAKRLIEEGLGVTAQAEQRSIYDLSPMGASAPAAAPAAAAQPVVVSGIPLAAAAITEGVTARRLSHDFVDATAAPSPAAATASPAAATAVAAPSPAAATAAAAPLPAAAGGARASAGALYSVCHCDPALCSVCHCDPHPNGVA